MVGVCPPNDIMVVFQGSWVGVRQNTAVRYYNTIWTSIPISFNELIQRLYGLWGRPGKNRNIIGETLVVLDHIQRFEAPSATYFLTRSREVALAM